MTSAKISADHNPSSAKPPSPQSLKRQQRKLEQEAAERKRVADEQVARQAWLGQVPLRLLALMALSRKVGGQVVVLGDVDVEQVMHGDVSQLRDLRVSIVFSGGSDSSIDIDAGLDVEQWQFELHVNHVKDLIAESKAAEDRLRLGRETWDGLSQAQRDALGLKARP